MMEQESRLVVPESEWRGEHSRRKDAKERYKMSGEKKKREEK